MRPRPIGGRLERPPFRIRIVCPERPILDLFALLPPKPEKARSLPRRADRVRSRGLPSMQRRRCAARCRLAAGRAPSLTISCPRRLACRRRGTSPQDRPSRPPAPLRPCLRRSRPCSGSTASSHRGDRERTRPRLLRERRLRLRRNEADTVRTWKPNAHQRPSIISLRLNLAGQRSQVVTNLDAADPRASSPAPRIPQRSATRAR